jgi:hypothetical protein
MLVPLAFCGLPSVEKAGARDRWSAPLSIAAASLPDGPIDVTLSVEPIASAGSLSDHGDEQAVSLKGYVLPDEGLEESIHARP